SYALSWKPCQGDSLNLPNYRFKDLRRKDEVERQSQMVKDQRSQSMKEQTYNSDTKITEESHHLALPLLERVPSHTTALATKGAIILLPTLNEIAASRPDSRLVEGTDEADLADLCAEIEDSLERDEGVSMRAVSAPTPRLGKRLGAPPSIAVVGASEPSHIGTSAPASISVCSLSLRGMLLFPPSFFIFS
nr:hypothetical protein [Tanacetum cinerariifolium]